MAAAIGAARVPRTSFKTAYTSKKTSTMSAMLRGSPSLLRYSVYGSSKSIRWFRTPDLIFAIQQRQFSFTKPGIRKTPTRSSADMLWDEFLAGAVTLARSLQKNHLHFRLCLSDYLLYLFDGPFYLASYQIVAQIHMRVDQDLFGCQMHRQDLNHLYYVWMTFNGFPNRLNSFRAGCVASQ